LGFFLLRNVFWNALLADWLVGTMEEDWLREVLFAKTLSNFVLNQSWWLPILIIWLISGLERLRNPGILGEF